MGIYVAVEQGDSTKSRGDLLEKLAKKMLESHDYEVQTEVRKTGMELDLLCQNKTNPNKKLYVECKAYIDDNKIQADVITNLAGRLYIQKYKEAWLIATSELGKEAKGLVDDIKQGEDADKFTFYTPERLVDALKSASIITSRQLSAERVKELIKDESKIGESHLLISSYGDFWFTEYLKGGVVEGVIFCNAKNGEIVDDEFIIANLEKLDFRFKGHDLGIIFRLLDPNDQTMQKRRLRGAVLRDTYLSEITDLGAPISSNKKLRASIEDIFVYPDIEPIDINTKEHIQDAISSERVLLEMHQPKNWLLLGDDLSGKSTLSYIFQKRIVESGRVAIRLSPAGKGNIKSSSFDKLLSKTFSEQYELSGIPLKTIEAYIADIRSEIIIVIDDFDGFNFKNASDRGKLINYLKQDYSSLIILANSSKELEYITSNQDQELSKDFAAYKILQLGHERRDDLIEKWSNINSEEPVNGKLLLELKEDISRRINIAIGTNYLPTYPFYCLTMLEMLESGSKATFQGNEYAELYGYFITHALGVNKVKAEDLGFYSAYLSYLASELHVRDTTFLSEDDLREVFTRHLQQIGLDLPFEKVHDKIVSSKILRIDDGCYSFNLSYYRYYFFAKYLSDSIEEQATRDTIKSLVDKLHIDENANTVIFLVHHSKRSEIIDAILDKAKKQFEDIKVQTLSPQEMEKINQLISEDMQLVLQDESVSEHRRKRLKQRDDYERRHQESNDKEKILDVYGQITLAFRTIDVLGKITSNYYGELKAVRKGVIIGELYELGFRSLQTFLQSFESYIDTLRAHIETKIDDKNLESESARRNAANQVIYTFTHLITYSFIKRVSDSVASKNLLITTGQVLENEGGPAAKLTSIAIKLNFPGNLKKYKGEIAKLYASFSGNSLARDLLRFIVLEHLYKFEVERGDKQSICDQLKIDITAVNRKTLKDKN